MALIDSFARQKSSARAPRRFGLLSYLALWRSRRDLAKLDARALKDIGLDSEAARIEARRSFWDVPETWRTR